MDNLTLAELEINVAGMARMYHRRRLGYALVALTVKRRTEEIQYMWLEDNEEAQELLNDWGPRSSYFNPRLSRTEKIRQMLPSWTALRGIMEREGIPLPL